MFSVRRDIIASYVGVNNMTSAISKLLKFNLNVLLLVIIWTYPTCWKWAVYHGLWMASFIHSTWPMMIWPTCCPSSSLADLPWYFLGILRWGHHHTPTTHHTTQPITTPRPTTPPPPPCIATSKTSLPKTPATGLTVWTHLHNVLQDPPKCIKFLI